MNKIRSLLCVIFVTALLVGCGLPYRHSVMSQVEYSSDVNQVANELGAALSRGVKFGKAESVEIRQALDEQRDARMLALYAFEQYRMTRGLFGHQSLEIMLGKLRAATKKVVATIHKHAGEVDRE